MYSFLQSSRAFGCSVIPVIDFQLDSIERQAIARFIRENACGSAIRLDLNNLASGNLQADLYKIMLEIISKPQDCILVLDLADADLSDVASFAGFVAEWIFRVQSFGLWRRVIVAATNYPQRNPAPENGSITISRNEWLAWQHALTLDSRVKKIAMFSDYGADNGNFDFGSGGRAIRHFRYATSDSWLIQRGGESKENIDGSIHGAAKAVVSSGIFAGDIFSAGDEFISACSKRSEVGNPTTWRTANMNHHMTRITVDIANAFKIQMPAVQRRRATQLQFF